MIETMPSHWLALVGVVFLLGLKHGLDPDHLAAIDGLTRFNARERPALSRWSGLLFSAGHGVVVTLVAIVVATVATADFTLAGVSDGWLANNQSSIASALPFSRARRTATAASHAAGCMSWFTNALHCRSSG